MLESRVPNGVTRMALSRYLARAYPLFNAKPALKRRDVKVNGARQSADYEVSAGDLVRVYDNFDMPIEVLGERDGLFAAVKPQGLPVDADADGVGEDTALMRARRIYPGAMLCHRLDAQTGGVLLFALSETARVRAVAEFDAHNVRKSYLAICGGEFGAAEGVYKDYMRKDPRAATVRITRARDALPIETRWRVIENIDGRVKRVELEPVTGRTHQLRAHMAFYGQPILGDDKYGDRTLNREYGTKLCLWCEELRILGAAFHADSPKWL